MGSSSSEQTVGYKHYMGMHLVDCYGETDAITHIWVGDELVWSGDVKEGIINIDAPEAFGGEDSEGGIVGAVDVLCGSATQGVNDYLQKIYGSDKISAFRGVASLVLRQVYLGTNPYLKTWSSRRRRIERQCDGTEQWYLEKARIGEDINPIHIIREILVSPVIGLGLDPDTYIDNSNFLEVAQTLYDENFGLSLKWTTQTDCDEFIKTIEEHINGFVRERHSDGKFFIKLARDDYNVEDLDIIDEQHCKEVQSFKRSTVDDLSSQITVKYYNREDKEDGSITTTDIALANQQGAPIAKTVSFMGINNTELANTVLSRERMQATTPLVSVTIVVDRIGLNYYVGDVFVWEFPPYGIKSMVLRIMEISYGEATSGHISLICIQDVFSVSKAVYEAPPKTKWQNPKNVPRETSHRIAQETPYYFVTQRLGDNEAENTPSDISYDMVACDSPTDDSYKAAINFEENGVYRRKGVVFFSPYGELLNDITELETSVDLGSMVDSDQIEIGTIAQIDNEIVRIDAIVDNKMTISRGILDTLPAKHFQGSFLLNWENYIAGSEIQRTINTTINVKITPFTGLGELNIDDAPVDAIPIIGRMHMPYPPANLKINDVFFPESGYYTDTTITWATRNRLTQTQPYNYTDYYSDNITPETGQQVSVAIKDENGTEIFNNTNAISPFTYDTELDDFNTETLPYTSILVSDGVIETTRKRYSGKLNINVKSTRDGLDSFQEYDQEIFRESYGYNYGKFYNGNKFF